MIVVFVAIATPNTFGQAAESGNPIQTATCQEAVVNGGFEAATTGNGNYDTSLQLCDESVPPTATAVNTPRTTPKAATPLSASTPAPVRVRAGTAQTDAGATTVTVPLDLVVLTDRVNVAVLSLDLHYNAALLRATNCATSQAMAPLLCNVSTPGRIQLAGVAAEGIRNELTLAEITFAVLQSVDRTAPLTIQLAVVGDVSGAAVSTDEQNGVITLTCAPESDDCTGIQIYLPLVHH